MGRILVIGATGLIGAPVARRLLADGHQVRLLVRDTGRASQRLGDSFEYLEDPAGLFGGTPGRFQSSGVPVVHDLFCGRLAPRPASCLAAEWCGHVDAAAALAGCSRAHCEDGAFVVPSGEPGDADPR
jgi:nucleoside-diphosphate-sugar epimerase